MDDLDIDRENQNFLLMLACLGYQQGWDLFPSEIIPRLKGLHHYYQAFNLIRLPKLTEQIRVLCDAGIPVMLLKGLALRLYYAPEAPRLMADYDVAVPEERFSEAMALLKGKSSRQRLTTSYHAELSDNLLGLEVHRWVFKQHGERGTDIWERAVHFQFKGLDVCVPCPEDMFIHLMDNRSRDIFMCVYPTRRMQWLCDCRHVFGKMPLRDLGSMAARAREFGVYYSVCHMMRPFSNYFPESISPKEVERCFPITDEYKDWMERGVVYMRRMERFRRHNYKTKDAITPTRICQMIWCELARYRFQCCEKGVSPFRYSFWQFFKDAHGVDRLAELWGRHGWRFRVRYREKIGE